MRGVWIQIHVPHSRRRGSTRLQEDDAPQSQAQGNGSCVTTKELQRCRENLMKKNPRCYWCEKRLVYVKMDGGPLPANFPTIDHINSRLMFPEGRPKQGKRVLSCPGCNQDRANKEMKTLGIDEIRRRSGRGRYSTSASIIDSSSLRELSSPSAQSGESRDPIARARSENNVLARSI